MQTNSALLSLQLHFCRRTDSNHPGWSWMFSASKLPTTCCPKQAGIYNQIAYLLLDSSRMSAQCSVCSCLPGVGGLSALRLAVCTCKCLQGG